MSRGKNSHLISKRKANGITHKLKRKDISFPLVDKSYLDQKPRIAFNHVITLYLEKPYAEIINDIKLYLDQATDEVTKNNLSLKLGLSPMTDEDIIKKAIKADVRDYHANKGKKRANNFQIHAMQSPSFQLLLILQKLGPVGIDQKKQCYDNLINLWFNEINRFRTSQLRIGLKSREVTRLERRWREGLITPLKTAGPQLQSLPFDTKNQVAQLTKNVDRQYVLNHDKIWLDFATGFLDLLEQAELRYQGEIKYPKLTPCQYGGLPSVEMPNRANYVKGLLKLWDKKLTRRVDNDLIHNLNFKYWGLGNEQIIKDNLTKVRLKKELNE